MRNRKEKNTLSTRDNPEIEVIEGSSRRTVELAHPASADAGGRNKRDQRSGVALRGCVHGASDMFQQDGPRVLYWMRRHRD